MSLYHTNPAAAITNDIQKFSYYHPKIIVSDKFPKDQIGIIAGLSYKPFVTAPPEDAPYDNTPGHLHGGIWFEHSICDKYCPIFRFLEEPKKIKITDLSEY
jgi:hypothetical protein